MDQQTHAGKIQDEEQEEQKKVKISWQDYWSNNKYKYIEKITRVDKPKLRLGKSIIFYLISASIAVATIFATITLFL
jgi:hypothetical protein